MVWLLHFFTNSSGHSTRDRSIEIREKKIDKKGQKNWDGFLLSFERFEKQKKSLAVSLLFENSRGQTETG
jgi:hypothetical protein